MGIQMRRGSAADFDANSLVQGEFAYKTDQKRLFLAHGDGTVKEVVFVEDYANGSGAANTKKVDHAIAADTATTAGSATTASSATTAAAASAAVTGSALESILLYGWLSLPSLTYVSADAPMYTATVPGDYSAKIGPGSRIRYTQGTVKYGLVHAAVTYNSTTGLSTIVLYGGGSSGSPVYPMTSATITSVSYTLPKISPPDFPLDPTKWQVTYKDTTGGTRNSPTAGTYYNLNNRYLDVPVGAWRLGYKTDAACIGSGEMRLDLYTTLSTSSSAASDADYTVRLMAQTSSIVGGAPAYAKQVTVFAKTRYYLLYMVNNSSIGSINAGGSDFPSIIAAESMYL